MSLARRFSGKQSARSVMGRSGLSQYSRRVAVSDNRLWDAVEVKL